jgi:hypothetical protein
MTRTVPIFPPRPADTTAEAERVQIELLRRAPVARRMHLAWSLSARAISAARRAIARANPESTPVDLDVRFVAIHYGAEIARAVQGELERRARRL